MILISKFVHSYDQCIEFSINCTKTTIVYLVYNASVYNAKIIMLLVSYIGWNITISVWNYIYLKKCVKVFMFIMKTYINLWCYRLDRTLDNSEWPKLLFCSYFPLVFIPCLDASCGFVKSLGVVLAPLGRPRPFFSLDAGAASLIVKM